MYYTTLETYKKKYQNRSLTHAYSAKTKGEHEAWKKSLRDRLREITGMNKCVYCEPDAQYLRTDRVNDLIAEYWVIKTEPEIEMPFYLLRPDQQKPDFEQEKTSDIDCSAWTWWRKGKHYSISDCIYS